MKIKVDTPKKVDQDIKYPVLAKPLHGLQYVVMCTALNKGVVVSDAINTDRVGQFSDTWTKLTNTRVWEILPVGTTVTLEQT